MLAKIKKIILSKKPKYIIIKVLILLLISFLAIYKRAKVFRNIEKADEIVTIKDNTKETTIEESKERLPSLDSKELEVLKEIYKSMEEGLFEVPATIIINNSSTLENLYIKKLTEKAYLFDGEKLLKLSESENKKYLLIDDISTFYYGYISNSLPNGEGNIINAYSADYNRYNYSSGTWKNGKLSGVGETGSAAFGEFPENTTTLYAIKGSFVDDILNGEISISITDEKGQVNTYILNADNGVSIIDDKIIHNEAMERYELGSLEDESLKYSIKDNEIKELKWINKVIFK